MKLVCLGDSLTYGYAVRRKAVWPALAAKETGARIVNCGVNGLLTAGMLGRLAKDVVAANATAVLLMGGANDILSGAGAAEAQKHLHIMASRSKAAGIRALIGIPVPFCPPVREDWAAVADFATAAPAYDAYAAWLRTFCADAGYEAVDFGTGFAQHFAETGFEPCSMYLDGIHLNENGHRVFAAVLVTTLRSLGLIA